MAPAFSAEDFLHAALRQSVLGCYGLACHVLVIGSSFDDLLGRQLSPMVTLSAQRSAFGDHILQILLLRAIEDVSRVVASAVVAGVAALFGGIVSMYDLVSHPMRMAVLMVFRDIHKSVAVERTERKGPNQALIGVVVQDSPYKVLEVGFSARIGWHRCSSKAMVLGASVA